MPQQQAILRAAGEHSVGLVHAPGDQVVDHHADVGLVAAQYQRLLAGKRQGGVDTGHQSLAGGLLVAGGAVDLSGQIQSGDALRLERRPQLFRREVVVLDGVAVAEDLRPLQPGDQPDHGVLHVAGKAGRQPVDIDLSRVAALGLQEQLVAVLVGEADHLGLQRWAVAGPGRLDLAGVHRRPVQVRPDQIVYRGVGVRDPARDLLQVDPVGEEGKRLGHLVAGLDLGLVEVDGPPVQARRRAGLESRQREAEPLQSLAEARGGPFAGASAGQLRGAVVKDPLHERAGAEHDRPGAVDGVPGAHAGDPHLGAGPFDDQVVGGLLAQGQPRLVLDDPLHLLLISHAVGLGAGAVHGGPLAAVEHAELDAGRVDRPGHGPAQGVDLAHDLPLGHAPDGRVAAHLGDGIEIAGQQRGRCPHARRRQRRLAPGMPGADHHDVEVVRRHTRNVEPRPALCKAATSPL